jgi:hypothetical protein
MRLDVGAIRSMVTTNIRGGRGQTGRGQYSYYDCQTKKCVLQHGSNSLSVGDGPGQNCPTPLTAGEWEEPNANFEQSFGRSYYRQRITEFE